MDDRDEGRAAARLDDAAIARTSASTPSTNASGSAAVFGEDRAAVAGSQVDDDPAMTPGLVSMTSPTSTSRDASTDPVRMTCIVPHAATGGRQLVPSTIAVARATSHDTPSAMSASIRGTPSGILAPRRAGGPPARERRDRRSIRAPRRSTARCSGASGRATSPRASTPTPTTSSTTRSARRPR